MTVATLTNRIRPTTGALRGDMRAARSVVVGVTMIVTLAQFFALSHEVGVRHFRCAEHGELTHVAVTSPELPPPMSRSTDAFRRGEADAPGGHDHCSWTFTVQGGASLPVLGGAARMAVPPPDRPPSLLAPVRDRAFVLASAPKTSPPVIRA